jgi:hypothetical protein
VTHRVTASLVSVRIAVGALFALGLVQFWIALAAVVRLSIVGGRLDAHPDLSAPIGNAILRPYWVSALGGVGALGLGLALVGAAWFVWRFGLRARWPALGLVAVVVAFQLMAALVWLTRARNRSVSGGGADGLETMLPSDGSALHGLVLPLPGAGAATSTVYDEAAAAVAWFGRADAAVVLVSLVVAALAVYAMRLVDGELQPEGRGVRLRPMLLAAGLVALAGVFAVFAFAVVRRLSTAYEVARSWDLSASPTDELARPFVRAVFLVGAPSLIVALAAATVAVRVVRARRDARVAAGAVGGLAVVPLLAGLIIGLASDREPGRFMPTPADGISPIRVVLSGGRLYFVPERGWASPDDDLTSRLLSLSTVDTVGQVAGLLLVGLILVTVVARRRERPGGQRLRKPITVRNRSG